MFANRITNFVTVGRHDNVVRDARIDNALPDADYQREAGEQAERFSGEAG
jgi:hypothetical protein